MMLTPPPGLLDDGTLKAASLLVHLMRSYTSQAAAAAEKRGSSVSNLIPDADSFNSDDAFEVFCSSTQFLHTTSTCTDAPESAVAAKAKCTDCRAYSHSLREVVTAVSRALPLLRNTNKKGSLDAPPNETHATEHKSSGRC